MENKPFFKNNSLINSKEKRDDFTLNVSEFLKDLDSLFDKHGIEHLKGKDVDSFIGYKDGFIGVDGIEIKIAEPEEPHYPIRSMLNEYLNDYKSNKLYVAQTN